MANQAEIDYSRIRIQVDSLSDGFISNQKDIKELVELTRDLHLAMYGNGAPENSARYRIAWSERMIRFLVASAVVNSAVAAILFVALAIHVLG